MSEMVERVASALWPEAFAGDGPGWDQRRDVARQQARAAIEAMREPTTEMFREVYDEDLDVEVRDSWQALIDAALSDKSK